MYRNLLLHQLRLTFKARTAIHGSVLAKHLRGHYSEHLAAISPCAGRLTCLDPLSCPYHYAFAKPLSTDPEIVRRHQKPPHPFVWQIPMLAETGAGDELSVDFILAGQATLHLADHIRAVRAISVDPDFCELKLEALTSVGRDGSDYRWGVTGDVPTACLSISSWDDLLVRHPRPAGRQRLTLMTPLRLLTNGRPMRSFDVSLFLRHLLRRCSAIAAYYGEDAVLADFAALAQASRNVNVIADRTRQVVHGGIFHGIAGVAEIDGDLDDFWPWLVLGQYLNVGKGAAFGMGQFTCEPILPP